MQRRLSLQPLPARILTAVLLSALLLVTAAAADASPRGPLAPGRGPTNVILFVSDGAGYNHFDAANLWESGRSRYQLTTAADGTVRQERGPAVQRYERFPHQFALETTNATGSYDPQRAWTDFDYVRTGATDSGAAATAMASGVKTLSGRINIDPDGQPLTTTLHRAQELGMATGVVASVPFSHATPAGWVAQNITRGDYHGIAEEMLLEVQPNVVMGAGHPFYDDASQPRSTPSYTFVSEATLGAVLDGATPYTFVDTAEGFEALASGTTDLPSHVLGVPRVAGTLQYDRPGPRHGVEPYEVPRNEGVPTLETMTRAALHVLDDASDDGFFVMIEGGAVDWAGHANSMPRLIEEQDDFNRSVDAAIDWVEEHSNWGETLMIVTSDHETGYLGGVGSNPTWTPMESNGAGSKPDADWHSGGHTNELVPFFAKGPGAVAFRFRVAGQDPVRGQYIDNTAVANVLFDYWGGGNS